MRTTPLMLAAMLAAPLVATPALADEGWESNLGFIIWEETMGLDAVLRAFTAEGTSGPVIRRVVPGRGRDALGGRGAYHGVWVASSSNVRCATEMLDPVSGAPTPFWGGVVVTFINDGFPSDWAGVYGNCLATPASPITARALVGEERNRAP